MRPSSTLLLSALLAVRVYSYDIPANVLSFYNGVKAKASCSNKLKSGFYAKDDGSNSFSYCGDHLNDYGVIYLQGTGGALADMDIDCDGVQHGTGDDGRCGSSSDTQSETSFKDTVAGYNKGVSDLNAYVHPYVVFGNSGSKSGYTTFNPQSYNIKPLSVMAVVCNGKMYYGIWGDENGDDGTHAMIGEASISLATLCFGQSMNGNNGHDETDVLYIAFTGTDTVPGASGATWNAASASEFETSLKALGDRLVQRIGGSTPTTLSTVTSSSPTPTSTCSWAGHCAGASCSTDDDCADDLICKSGKCASSTTCSWAGHCAGASCSSDDDCSDDLYCSNGKCTT